VTAGVDQDERRGDGAPGHQQAGANHDARDAYRRRTPASKRRLRPDREFGELGEEWVVAVASDVGRTQLRTELVSS
jgi:hypothetical protein